MDHPSLDKYNSRMALDEPELYTEILTYVDIIKKRKIIQQNLDAVAIQNTGPSTATFAAVPSASVATARHSLSIAKFGGGRGRGGGKGGAPSTHIPPPPKSTTFKTLLEQREDSLHEMMLVCLIGLWHYLRECPSPIKPDETCSNKALCSVIKDVGLKDMFSMCSNSDELETQRCAFGTLSELCRLNFRPAYHLPICELVVVFIEKKLYQIKQYQMQQDQLKQTEIKTNQEAEGDKEHQSTGNKHSNLHSETVLTDPMDIHFSDPLLYLLLQLIKGTNGTECRNLLIERNVATLVLKVANECIHNIVVVRTCMSIMLHLHDPESLHEVSKWLKASQCDDVHVHIYVALCVWRTLVFHPASRDVWILINGIELPIRLLSKLINRIKRTGRQKVEVEKDPILLTLLKGLLGLIWMTVGSDHDTIIDLFVASSGVNLMGALLRWKQAPKAISIMATTILWITAHRQKVQVQIIRTGLLTTILAIIHDTQAPFEERLHTLHLFELVYMDQKMHVNKELKSENVFEQILMNFIDESNNKETGAIENTGGVIQIQGLCGLARVAFSSRQHSITLVEMGCVTKVYECIENGIHVLSNVFNELVELNQQERVVVDDEESSPRRETAHEKRRRIHKEIQLEIRVKQIQQKKHLQMMKMAQLKIAKGLHVLMNLTVLKSVQLLIGKLGFLRTIFQTCQTSITIENIYQQFSFQNQRHNVTLPEKNDNENMHLALEVQMYAERLISNVSKHEKNRTPLYKLELEWKSKEIKKAAKQKKSHGSRKTTIPNKEVVTLRIKKRRDAQEHAFINRQKLARYKDTSSQAATVKYESRFEQWKKAQSFKVRPPSLFENKQQPVQKTGQKHVAMRPASAASRTKPQSRRSQRIHQTSPLRTSSSSQKRKTIARPQSANPRSRRMHKQSNNKDFSVSMRGAATTTAMKDDTKMAKAFKAGLIQTMCRPMISMFNSKNKQQRVHRKSTIEKSAIGMASRSAANSGRRREQQRALPETTSAMTSSMEQANTLHPVSCGFNTAATDSKKSFVQAMEENTSIISSYLKPLQFIGEDDYNQWQPRIKCIKSTKNYVIPNLMQKLNPDGSLRRDFSQPHSSVVESIQSPGKPPANNASKKEKDQYVKRLQEYIVNQASKTTKGRNKFIYKPQLGRDHVDLINNPIQCALSSTSKPFEFRLSHQYSKYQAKTAGTRPGDKTLCLSSSAPQKANTISTWVHRKGATVFDGTIPRFATEDGREMYFFHTHALHEQESPAPQAQQYPACLLDLGLLQWFHDPIPPRIHCDTSLNVKVIRNDPPVSLMHAPQLQLQTDRMTFLIGKDVPEPMKEKAIERPPYLPPVFLLRYASSDTQSLYNFKYDALEINIKQESFDLDWKRMNEKNYLIQQLTLQANDHNVRGGESGSHVPVVSKQMMQTLKKAVYASYDIILRLHTYYSASGSGTICGLQLNAFRQFLKETQLDQCKIGTGKASLPLDKSKLDQMFSNIDSPYSHSNDGRSSLSNIDVSSGGDKSLVRFEFMTLLILLSRKLFAGKAIDQAFHTLVTQHVVKTLQAGGCTTATMSKGGDPTKQQKQLMQILQDQDEFREKRLYTREVNLVYQHFLKGLHDLFLRYSGSRIKMTGRGVALFLNAVEQKKKAKKRWVTLKKKRKMMVSNAAAKSKGKGSLVKKKIIGKMNRISGGGGRRKRNKNGNGSSKKETEAMKMMNKQYIREVSRADAAIALAGYHPVDGHLYETLMPLDNWLSMLHDLNLIGQGLSIREATWCFTWSLMHVRDELMDQHKRDSLSFTDFLEAFGRLAELVPLPTMQEILMKTKGSTHFDASATLIKFLLNNKNCLARAKTGGFHRRKSAQSMLIDEKHRALDEKLYVLLSVVWEKVEFGTRQMHVDSGDGGRKSNLHAFQ